jgi:hypothetical protein
MLAFLAEEARLSGRVIDVRARREAVREDAGLVRSRRG